MKFCRDCKWAYVGFFERLFEGYKFAECHHPEVSEQHLNPVTGKLTRTWLRCEANRDQIIGKCLKEGKYWEIKE